MTTRCRLCQYTVNRVYPLLFTFLSTVLILELQQFSAIAVNANVSVFIRDSKPRFHYRKVPIFVRGGGDSADDDDEDRRKELGSLLHKAQLASSELLDDTNNEPLSISLKRFLTHDRKVPLDLFMICNLQCLYTRYPAGPTPQDKDSYMKLKSNFVREMDEHFSSAGEDMTSWNAADGNKNLIESCINLLGSDYLHSIFVMPNFRQQVVDNPFWKGLVKTALITHLGDDCPRFDEILLDDNLWTDTLLSCM